MLHGEYPADLITDTAGITDWSFIHATDLAEIHQPLDALGLNYYTPSLVSSSPSAPTSRSDGHGASDHSPGRERTTSPSTNPRASVRRWAGPSTRRACTT